MKMYEWTDLWRRETVTPSERIAATCCPWQEINTVYGLPLPAAPDLDCHATCGIIEGALRDEGIYIYLARREEPDLLGESSLLEAWTWYFPDSPRSGPPYDTYEDALAAACEMVWLPASPA